MRLVLATPSRAPGADQASFAGNLARQFSQYGWDGVTVSLEAVRGLPPVAREVAFAWHVFRAARSADAVLALDPTESGIPALIAARLSMRPFMLYVPHDGAWKRAVDRYKVLDSHGAFTVRRKYPVMLRAHKMVQAFVATAATRVFVADEHMARVVHLWNVPRECITIAPEAEVAPAFAATALDTPEPAEAEKKPRQKGKKKDDTPA